MTQNVAKDAEVLQELAERGVHGLDRLSLEELQLLTERKRRQLEIEAHERKAQLESEISSVEQQIQDLGARKIALTAELDAVKKSLGLSPSGSERSARRAPRKNKTAAEAEQPAPAAE